ncbi:MAG: hypothetical protein H6810_04585 [Phycisphaeraceae bacterium]|nr:MAG: hypothetical protein H6810_04585 [Phycisphaeraceae bacterium]
MAIGKALAIVGGVLVGAVGAYNYSMTGCPLGSCDDKGEAAVTATSAEGDCPLCAGESASGCTKEMAAQCTDEMAAQCEGKMGQCPDAMAAQCEGKASCEGSMTQCQKPGEESTVEMAVTELPGCCADKPECKDKTECDPATCPLAKDGEEAKKADEPAANNG